MGSEGRNAFYNRLGEEGLSDKVTFERSEQGGRLGKSNPGGGNSNCKCPEVAMSMIMIGISAGMEI